jgi:hypothetical protein
MDFGGRIHCRIERSKEEDEKMIHLVHPLLNHY